MLKRYKNKSELSIGFHFKFLDSYKQKLDRSYILPCYGSQGSLHRKSKFLFVVAFAEENKTLVATNRDNRNRIEKYLSAKIQF